MIKTLKAEEAAQALMVNKKTIYSLAKKGKLIGKKAGKRWVFTHDAIMRYLNTPEEAQCQSSEEKTLKFGEFDSRLQTEDEYKSLLALQTANSQKSMKRSSKRSSGEKTD